MGTDVVVIGGGYAGVMAANRLTQRDDVTVTLINPRTSFVERVRLHQLVGGSDDALVEYGLNQHLTLRMNVYNLTDEIYVRNINNNGGRYNPGFRRTAQVTTVIAF